MQDARPGSAAEQTSQPEQRRMKHRHPRQGGEHESNGDDPVIGALAGTVALDDVATLGITCHVRFSAAGGEGRGGAGGGAGGRAAAASSLAVVSLRPTRM